VNPAASLPAFDRVLQDIGTAIVRGEFPAGHGETIEGLVDRTGASRSIVREVTRVLGNLGMLSAGRRIGLRVLDRQHWDALDPLVIRWRLDGVERVAQLNELRALRRAVEPEAAAAAADAVRIGGASQQALDTLTAAAEALEPAAASPDPDVFLRADRDLHAAILKLSGNIMFERLRSVIEEALRERALHEHVERRPRSHDIDLHRRVAQAVAAGRSEAAASAMRDIVDRTRPHM
jgi:DNA-binding FadR family transcriptional regulator